MAMQILVVAALLVAGCSKHEAAARQPAGSGGAPAAAAASTAATATDTPPVRPVEHIVTDSPGDGRLDLYAHGIGFDDMLFSKYLGDVVVPGGGAGRLYVINPSNREIRKLSGPWKQADYKGGHGDGVTSVDDFDGRLAVTDRTTRTLTVVDPLDGKVIASAKLTAEPDYVRTVKPTGELWVTEPEAQQIEIFKPGAGALTSSKTDRIAVKGGPESLVIDGFRNRAYTHLWDGSTVAIDLTTRKIVSTWSNRCKGARGIALDEIYAHLFVGCADGGLTVLDLDHDGAVLGSVAPAGLGHVDIIAYNHHLHHVYLSGSDGVIAIVGIDRAGVPTTLGTVDGAKGSHCATTDGTRIYACDPKNGAVVIRTDPYPETAYPAP